MREVQYLFFIRLLSEIFQMWRDPSLRTYKYLESGSKFLFAIDVNLSSHLFHNHLANTQSESSTSRIPLLVLANFHEIHKNVWQVFLLDTYSAILNFNSEFQVTVCLFVIFLVIFVLTFAIFNIGLITHAVLKFLYLEQYESDDNVTTFIGELDCIR